MALVSSLLFYNIDHYDTVIVNSLLGICDWQEIDINEFNNDNMDTAVIDANQNILSSNCDQNMLSSNCDQNILPSSCDYNMNQCSIPSDQFHHYDLNAYTTDCMSEMPSSPTDTMLYGFPSNCCTGYLNNNNFPDVHYFNHVYSPNNSLETNSSPDSSLNDNYRQGKKINFKLGPI